MNSRTLVAALVGVAAAMAVVPDAMPSSTSNDVGTTLAQKVAIPSVDWDYGSTKTTFTTVIKKDATHDWDYGSVIPTATAGGLAQKDATHDWDYGSATPTATAGGVAKKDGTADRDDDSTSTTEAPARRTLSAH